MESENAEIEVRAGLALLHPDTDVIELRPMMPDERWWSGYFDDREQLVQAVLSLNQFEAKAVYWTLNPLIPAAKSRVTNLLAPAKKGGCVKNDDVDKITTLFLDYDYKSGPRSSVVALATRVENYLGAHGWPKPLMVDSGTGYYHFFKIDVPAAEKGVVKDIINNLADRFDTDEAILDRKCANPGRIARVPGTFNRKGVPRMAHIIRGR